MVATDRWKFMHAEGGFPPMLFDVQADPQELQDLGRSPDYQGAVQTCYEMLHDWALRCSQRTSLTTDQLIANRGKSRRKGIVLGLSEAADAEPEILSKYRGKPPPRPQG